MAKTRLDLALVERGLAKSRAQAQQLIINHYVTFKGQVVLKPSFEIEGEHFDQIEISENNLVKYVSRGGLKLEGALRHVHINVTGLTALDIGISTGGFTDCLLQKGAARVVGVDVGHGQLDNKIARDPRVVHLENLNARELTKSQLAPHEPANGFDLIVIDVSFISLEHILPAVSALLSQNGSLLALVKPQFEAGRAALSKSGIVKDPKAFDEVRKKIYKICENLKLVVEDYFESSISGADGNKEFFILTRHS